MTVAPLQYFGGKSKMIPYIMPLMDNCDHYLWGDIYGGSGVVSLNKRPAHVEYYNDLNGRLFNFFQVAINHTEELIKRLNMTLYSRREVELSKETSPDPIEDARRLFVALNQSSSGRLNNISWIRSNHKNKAQGRKPKNFHKKIKTIYNIRDRFKCFYVENRPAIELCRYLDDSGALLFLDPPYLPETRTAVTYTHEMNRDDHKELLDFCVTAQSKIILCGYKNDLYNEALTGWGKIQVEMGTRGTDESGGQVKRVECIWFNFDNEPKERQLSLI